MNENADAIAVPRRSTLTDVVQSVTTVNTPLVARGAVIDAGNRDSSSRMSRNKATVPANPALWRALLQALKDNPVAQQPPLFLLEDKATKDAVLVNQVFLREFVESWEEDGTHLVTVSSATSIRTFRASVEFWTHVIVSYNAMLEEQPATTAEAAGRRRASTKTSRNRSRGAALAEKALLSRPTGDSLSKEQLAATTIVTVKSSGKRGDMETRLGSEASTSDAAILAASQHRTLQMTLEEWNSVVSGWNSKSAPATATGEVVADDDLLGEHGRRPRSLTADEESSAYEGRPRALAVLDPDTSPDVLHDAMALLRRREQGSRYWTHFMKHWALLEAQYRNYL